MDFFDTYLESLAYIAIPLDLMNWMAFQHISVGLYIAVEALARKIDHE